MNCSTVDELIGRPDRRDGCELVDRQICRKPIADNREQDNSGIVADSLYRRAAPGNSSFDCLRRKN